MPVERLENKSYFRWKAGLLGGATTEGTSFWNDIGSESPKMHRLLNDIKNNGYRV
jgi:hypothetical protein